MKIPLQITTRDFDLTEADENAIREKAKSLDLFYDKIMSCRVLVEIPHRHQRKGILYNVRIEITVPDGELVVKKEPHEDLFVAIRSTFNTARRQLQDYAEQRRGDVKYHEEMPRARVGKLFPERGVNGREKLSHLWSSKMSHPDSFYKSPLLFSVIGS